MRIRITDAKGQALEDTPNRALRVSLVSGSIALTGADGAVLDGANTAIRATVKSYTNSNPQAVVLVDTNGDPYTAGGGTQYTNGAVVAAPVGTAALGWDGTNVRVVKVSAAGVVAVDGSGVTQPVSAASLPLPTGAATGAKQDTGNASLASIDTKLSGALSVTGPLTDAQLRAAAVPVADGGGSLTVDATSWPLPTGAAQDATLTGGTAKAIVRGGAKGVTAAADVTSANVDANTQALHVSLVQSGATVQVSDAGGSLSVDDGGLSLTVDGTVTGNQGTAGSHAQRWMVGLSDGAAFISPATDRATAAAPFSIRLSDGAAFYDAAKTGQLPAALVGGRLDANNGAWLGSTAPTVGQKAMASSLPVVVASDQSAIPVTAPTLTKGTQGANGFSVQNLKDAGRVLKVYTVSGLATVTAEALISLTPYADLTAGGAATTFGVTAGKRLRLQTLIVTARATSTVNVGGIVRFRMLAGTVLVGSPVHASLGVMSSNLATAVAGNAQSFTFNFPDGFELSGTMQFGLTQLFSATTATIDVHVIGYEY